jgi:ornithine carbamoyltransferase
VTGEGPGDRQVRHFLELADLGRADLRAIVDTSSVLKRARASGAISERPLRGIMLAMIFERPSTRTRVSFDVGMRELGGETIILSGSELQIGRGETISDTAKVMSRYVDAIMIRVLDHDMLVDLARYATVPVINGLTRRSHPTQVMADILTFEENLGPIAGKTVAWAGDSNNVLTSWIQAAGLFDFKLRVAAPPDAAPGTDELARARASGADIAVSADPYQAVDGAHCVVTDTWVSMGDEETERRHNLLKPYQVTEDLMAAASSEAIFMHCLPAHRGEEVTAQVIDGPQSVVFDEAENRLHAHKGILMWCLDNQTKR